MGRLQAVVTLLSSCEIAENEKQAHACKLLSDLDSFNMHDWECPHKK